MSESKSLDEGIVTALEFAMKMVGVEIGRRKPPSRRQRPTTIFNLELVLRELSDALVNQHDHMQNAVGDRRFSTAESIAGQNLKLFEDTVETAASELNKRNIQPSLQIEAADRRDAIEYGLILARMNNSRINLLNHIQKSAATGSLPANRR